MPPTERISVKSLIWLTLPAALSAMLNNAYRVIDQHAVQWLGVDAQAAIASCTFVLIGFYAIYSIFSAGVISPLARAVGSRNKAEQQSIIGNVLVIALLTGVVVLTLNALSTDWTVNALGLTGSLAEQAEAYLQWYSLSCLAQTVMPTLDAIFIAYGRTKMVLGLQIAASVLNFLLNPIFIYWLDFGIGGAALATGISQTFALVIGLTRLTKSGVLQWRYLSVNRYAAKIIRIGLPMCWGTLVFAGVYWALLRWVISPLGAEVNAALGIGFSVLEGFTWPVFWGFSMGIASLVGRCLGAGEIAQAKYAVNLAFKMMSLCGLLAAGIFWLAGRQLASIFTNDTKVLEQAVLYAQILAFSQLFVAYEALAEGILSGAGKTRTIFYRSVPLNILRVPLAWWFAIHEGWGALAVWWVINLSTILKTAGKWAAVLSGRWCF